MTYVTTLLCSVLLLPSLTVASFTPTKLAIGPVRATALGAKAFLYGYPLMEFLRARAEMTSVNCPDSYGNAPVNAISNTAGFATPDVKVVVAPNVDTLYSVAHLDLSNGPVVLSHPDMGDRYFVFQYMDPYTNTLGYIGSRTTGSQAGSFAFRWTGGPDVAAPEGTNIIDVPYQRIWILGRTLAGDEADEAVAHRLMDQYTVTPPGGARTFTGCTPSKPKITPQPEGIAYLDAISNALAENPPPAADKEILDELKAIGVGPGMRVDDAHLSRATLRALDKSVRLTSKGLGPAASAQQFYGAATHGGWSSPPDNIGDYGTDYTLRAGVAKIGLGANTPEEAAYKTAFLDSSRLPLNGTHDYSLTFPPGQAPPQNAFWSVTVYDSDGVLIDNAQHVYATRSTDPGLITREDGSIKIVFSQHRPSEDAVNWIPVSDTTFRVYLRIYAPQQAVLDGTWRPPGIRKS